MKKATVKIEGVSPLYMGRYHNTPSLNRETKDDHEKRTWRERLHYDDKGEVFLTPMFFKNCLSGAAKYLSMQVPGKGKSTYTKHIEAGVLVQDRAYLGIQKDDVPGDWLYVPSDGKRGGTNRVPKCFPKMEQWAAEVPFYILDDIITEDVFAKHLEVAGNFIGLGCFRPRNNGYCGRFKVNSIDWEDESD